MKLIVVGILNNNQSLQEKIIIKKRPQKLQSLIYR